MEISELTGGMRVDSGAAPFEGAQWYRCDTIDSGIRYRFAPGALADMNYLGADVLLDGQDMVTCLLVLQEGDDGPAFDLLFALLPQVSARIRMPLAMVDQAKWRFEREGAWLKPMARGQRVDLRRVDRATLEVHRKSEAPVRFAVTRLDATVAEPPLLDRLILPAGKLLDPLGQSAIREWPGKTRDEAELRARLTRQNDRAESQRWPVSFSAWGGVATKSLDATGFFRTHHDGKRWWLVDPDGHPFWSAGVDCVLPSIDAAYEGLESALEYIPDDATQRATRGRERGFTPYINYLGVNFHRVFGEAWHDAWKRVVLAELRRIGFNTVANWSEWQIAREAGFPYVRPLAFGEEKAPFVYRDLPDVFHVEFARDADRFAEQLRETADDPALIGYFLMNEPTWGFAEESPAAGMLYTYASGPARDEFARFLTAQYGSDSAINAAWGIEGGAARVREGLFSGSLSAAAIEDCKAFSGVMVERFFTTLSDTCRAVDSNHLNLGIRYQTVPPDWAVAGMRSFDVFSMNCYDERVPSDVNAEIAKLLGMPVMIGEWHFGALDAGLPGTGIGHVRTQADRARAYRYYVETAAADPNCVGVHYFTLYDQSAIGRFDGEAYQIGFIDGCHRPYPEICDAARASHEAMYDVADGTRKPFLDKPEYLPKLFV